MVDRDSTEMQGNTWARLRESRVTQPSPRIFLHILQWIPDEKDHLAPCNSYGLKSGGLFSNLFELRKSDDQRPVRDLRRLRVEGALLLGAGLLPRRPTPLRRAAARDRGGRRRRAAGATTAGTEGNRTKFVMWEP